MKDSWRSFCRRLAVTTVVSGSVAWSSAMCYATQLAFDSTDDPVYADGWQGSRTNNTTGLPEGPVGDNGGFGFEPWNFDTDWWFYTSDGIHGIDDGLKAGTDSGTDSSSTYNDLGKAWRIAHPATGDEGLPRAGRGFPTLQPGQTFRVVVDNPLAGAFFKGYFVRFNTRYGLPDHIGGNICYGGQSPHPGSCYDGDYAARGQVNVSMFQYVDNGQFTDGRWFISDNAVKATGTTLYDTDKIADPFPFGDPMPYFGTDRGMRIDLTIDDVDANFFTLTMTPFNDDGSLDTAHAFVHHGEVDFLDDGIDWIEFTFFNGDITDPGSATDFYIRSMEIFDDVGGVEGDYNNDGKVNAADYTLWRDNLGAANETALNDNGDGGGVTASDYTYWKQRYGSPGAGGGALAGSGVPEPATSIYLIAAGIAGMATLRRGKESNRGYILGNNSGFDR
jgi:hypothetical protein